MESGLTGLESAVVVCGGLGGGGRSGELLLQGLFGAERALCGRGAALAL